LKSNTERGPPPGNKSGLVAYCRLEKIKRAYWVTKHDGDFGVTTFEALKDINGEPTRFLKNLSISSVTSWDRQRGYCGRGDLKVSVQLTPPLG